MISIPKLRASLGLGPDRDDEIGPLLDDAVALFESMTGYLWKLRAGRVDIFEPLDKETVVRTNLVTVNTLTTVEVREGFSDSTWETLTATTDYEQIRAREIVRVGQCWEPLVRVTYDGGYADDMAPADVLKAITIQIRYERERHEDGRIVLASQNFKGGSGAFLSAAAHPVFQQAAKRHRRIA